MMGLQILAEEIDSAALACCMTDEDDCFRMDKIRCNLFVVRFFLWNMITLIMGFFAMDQMMLESERIIRLNGDFIFRPVAAEIVVNVGNMMVDDHNHPPDLVCFFGLPEGTSFL